ncbi:hypothetical protein NL676_005839 [Syzygium grande]|nr:hypothetical protein NL676_005839 [Syzygium grande]
MSEREEWRTKTKKKKKSNVRVHGLGAWGNTLEGRGRNQPLMMQGGGGGGGGVGGGGGGLGSLTKQSHSVALCFLAGRRNGSCPGDG